MRSTVTAAAVALALAAPFAGPAEAAYYHDLQKNRQPCSDCHVLHYSESGSTPGTVEPGGPFGKLIVRSTTNKLCFFCHDGSDPKAPDVLGPVVMYDGSGDEHSGAGFFANSGGTGNPNGHDLDLDRTIPFSSRPSKTLSCASCHDPHGTPNYRNVVTAPAGGTGVGVVMGTDVFRESPPGDPPSAAGSIAAYRESNEGYKAGASRWCVECHDDLKPHVGGTARVQNHHLVHVPINWTGQAPETPPTDPAHWAAGTGAGFGVATGDGVEGVPRLRFQVSGATDFPSSKIVAPTNEVTCGTCHLAHGGKYRKGLVWPNIDSGSPVDAASGCQQCHNQ